MKKFIVLFTVLVFSVSTYAQTKVVEFNTKKSEVKWEGGKKLILQDKHYGTVDVQEGEMELDKKDEMTGGYIVIDMESINNEDIKSTKNKKRLEAHLMSVDFFDVENYPEAKLVLKSVKKDPKKNKKSDNENEAGEVEYTATGELEIRGKKHLITIPLKVTKLSDVEFNIKSDFKIDRTKWNVKYNSGKFFKNLGDKVIKDEIDLSVNLTTQAKSKK